jgi:hypothetical protein
MSSGWLRPSPQIAYIRNHQVLGFDIIVYSPDEVGVDAAFLSAGGYHDHIGLNTRHSAGGTPPPQGHTGLYDVAFLYLARLKIARGSSYSPPKILPGFIMPFGSAILFISRMNGNASPCSFCRCPVFPRPIPCSPVQVPPRSRA